MVSNSVVAPSNGWLKKLAAALAMLLLYEATQVAAHVLRLSRWVFSPDVLRERTWIGAYEHHFWQLVFALLLIGLFSHGKFSEWGLNCRDAAASWRILRGFCFVYFFIELGIGVVPPLLMHQRPSFSYPVTAVNIVGWLSFTWMFVGLSEEILFRGLIHTFLAQTWTGVSQVRKLEIPHAGIVTTVIFCLAHINPFHPQVFWDQQLWAFGLGLYFSTVYHRTGSLLNPILAHNYSDGLVFAAQYVLYWWLH
jgi:membrane protease YdiL (CAAX protease family)